MRKRSKGKIIAYCCIVLVFLFLFVVYVLFFSGISQYSFFPFVLGILTTGAIYIVRAHGQKPIAIDLTENQDNQDNPQTTGQSGDGSVIE